MTDFCHICGESYNNLSMHWVQSSSCDFPELSEKQTDIITGVLMGDGTVYAPSSNPLLSVEMITSDFLYWLDKQLGKYGKGVRKVCSAEESAKRVRDRGFRPNAESDNYSALYRLDTRTSPEFEQFLDWYSTGEKVFPRIHLSPMVLKCWYVCDGSYCTNGGKDRIEISAVNEIDRFDNIVTLFDKVGLEARTSGKTIYFSNSESSRVFDYIGESLPGFEYKWPE